MEKIKTFFNHNYKPVCKIFNLYWKTYGGWKSVFCSLYFHLSILLTIIILWANRYDESFLREWMGYILSTSPNLIGISLTGMTVFLAIGDDKFKAAIRGESPSGKSSPMMVFIASFTHFVLLQTFSLINAVIGRACLLNCSLYKIFSVLIFVYALLTVISTVMAIYRIAMIYDSAKVK